MGIYTLIAYKPTGSYFNCCYETEIFDSVLEIYSELSMKELEERLVEIFYKNIIKDMNDENYIVNILEDCIHIYKDDKNICGTSEFDKVIEKAKLKARNRRI